MEVNVQVYKHEGQVMCGYEVVSGSVTSAISLENKIGIVLLSLEGAGKAKGQRIIPWSAIRMVTVVG